MDATTAASRSDDQYVTLGIDGEVFAVEVERVREILDMRPISRMPNAPPFLLGMIDVRGQGVAVVDLRVKLGLPAVPPTEHTRIVVLKVPIARTVRLMGLVADRVFEVAALGADSLKGPPEIGVRWRSNYIRGIGRRDGGFVIVFDIVHLLNADEAALLPG
jgi:purine-binding chemotaxis protein CheW